MCRRPIADAAARADFDRARRAYLLAHAAKWLGTRRSTRTRPRDLGDVRGLYWHSKRLRPIPVDAIVGTVDPTTDFDADFRPASNRVAARWQRVARAHREGRPLPPIAVIEQPDGYYVLDGRHRVSVARELGGDYLDAWVSQSAPAVQPRRRAAPPARERQPVRRLDHALSAR